MTLDLYLSGLTLILLIGCVTLGYFSDRFHKIDEGSIFVAFVLTIFGVLLWPITLFVIISLLIIGVPGYGAYKIGELIRQRRKKDDSP